MIKRTTLEQLQTTVVDAHQLYLQLRYILTQSKKLNGDFTLTRQPLDKPGTFLTEIVTCEMDTGEKIKFLCKYGPKGNKRYRAVGYEGMIYTEFINEIPFTKIQCFQKNILGDSDLDGCWLVLDYLEGSERIIDKEAAAFYNAAAWIAKFHQYFESKELPSVKVYDEAYYLSLLVYVERLAEKLDEEFTWFLKLCRYFRKRLWILTASPQTLIHGEYYGKNLLVKDDEVYPVDWETAAIGPAEIDLAALMDGKDETRAAHAFEGYINTRYPDGKIPEDFEQRLLLAKIFYPFRWITEWQLEFAEFERWMTSDKFGGTVYQLWLSAQKMKETEMLKPKYRKAIEAGKAIPAAFPGSAQLMDSLANLVTNKTPGNAIKNVTRELAVGNGTFRAEIVSCQLDNNQTLTLRCKYLNGTENNTEGGHRGGVSYESRVYEEVLNSTKLSIPNYFGTFRTEPGNLFCMVLEFLTGAERINKSLVKDVMVKAAAWAGQLHAHKFDKVPEFVTRYDENYYQQWVVNTNTIVKEFYPDCSWIDRICDYFLANINVLTQGPQTVIHGEYYPNNVLIHNNTIYTIDWESTAFGPGEIDLASLTEGYEGEKEQNMIHAYVNARWPGQQMETDAGFLKRLSMARLYFQFRWIGRYTSLNILKQYPSKFENFDRRISKFHKLITRLGL